MAAQANLNKAQTFPSMPNYGIYEQPQFYQNPIYPYQVNQLPASMPLAPSNPTQTFPQVYNQPYDYGQVSNPSKVI